MPLFLNKLPCHFEIIIPVSISYSLQRYIVLFINVPSSIVQDYDAIEVYAGVGTLSRQLRAAGFSTCTLDIVDWNPWIQERILRSRKRTCKGNPLDLTTASGFAFLSVQ